MSRLDDLISQLCPSGVGYAALGDVARTVPGLSGKTKADFADGGNARFVSYRNVFDHLSIDQHAPDFVRVASGERQSQLHDGDIIFTGSSENLDEVGMSSTVIGEPVEPLYLNSFCFAVRFADPSILLPAFSKHLFRSETVRAQIRRSASGVTRINISKHRFLKVKIPLPPVEVQREVVNILDPFTELEAELEAQLKSELEARRVQYAHYRQLLLDEVDAEPVAVATLGKWHGGMTPSKSNPAYWQSGTVPWLASMDVSDSSTNEIRGRITPLALKETSLRVVPAPSVAVVMRSNILRRRLPIGLITVETTVNQDMRILVPRDGVDAGYVYQVLRADSERIRTSCVRTDGSMAAVDSKSFLDWRIPLPSVPEQQGIAEKLRWFDSVVNDLCSNLYAEQLARRKQYGFHREKLLTFEEVPA